MELPPAIAPWGPELAMFRDEIALALGGMVARVAHAIGPLPAAARDARDEPDGFGGLARRGPYERLLLTEWLLATELPDEFIRRAASAEHAFLELEHLSPATERRTIAVFDAGPSQLGAPRLAQLAVLIALARRAHLAGATLGWVVLQEGQATDEVVVREGLTPATAKALFATARSSEPSGARLSRVRAGTETKGAVQSLRDTWVVGGAVVSRLAAESGSARVEISDVIDGGAKRLRVVVAGASSGPRAVELELPPDPLIARLFRDPFKPAAPSAPALRASGAPSVFFASSGTKVYARVGGRAYAMTVPEGSPGFGSVKKITWPELVAVGRLRRETVWLFSDPATRALTLRLGRTHIAAGHFTTEPGAHAPWRPDPEGPLVPLVVRRAGSTWSAFYRDERGWLFGWSSSGGRAALVDRGVMAVATDGVRIATVSKAPEGRLSVFPVQPTETLTVPVVIPIGEEPILEAHLHFRVDGSVLAAVRTASDRYRVVDSKDGLVSAEFEVAESLRAVGVTPSPFGRGALIAVTAGGRVVLAGPSWSRDLFELESGASDISVDPLGKSLAALHERGVLELFRLDRFARIGTWDLAKEAR